MRPPKFMNIDEMASAILEIALEPEGIKDKAVEDAVKSNVKYFNIIREKIASIERPDGNPPECPPNDPDCAKKTRKNAVNILKLSLSKESFPENNITERIDGLINCINIIYHSKQN